MKPLFKTTLITAALFATTPLFANTAVETNAKVEAQQPCVTAKSKNKTLINLHIQRVTKLKKASIRPKHSPKKMARRQRIQC